MYWDYIQLVNKNISGEIAKENIMKISQYHRIQASKWFHDAITFLVEEIKKIGLSPEVHKFKADGEIKYFEHKSPIGWHAEFARLEMIEPKYQKLADFLEVPSSLIVHSKSTPEKGVTTEVIYVGKGNKNSDYENKDVSGKIVLAYGRPFDVHYHAVEKRGAVGIILFNKNIKNPEAYPYLGFWPSKSEIDKITFGFTLPYKKAMQIISMLEDGKKVVVKAQVKSEFFESNLEVVTVTVSGTDLKDEEVLLISHICHPKPGANDNASGSGLLIEILRVLKELLDSKRISLRRTIRFMWVPEFYGTFAFLYSHPEIAERIKFGINLDMVGEDQEKTKSVLTIVDPPLSNYSFISSAMEYFISTVSEMGFEQFGGLDFLPKIKYKRTKYIGGSDHAVFVDSTYGIPFTALIQWPDIFYHSSSDDISKVSPNVLKIIGTAALSLALSLANPSVIDAYLFANRLYVDIILKIAEYERRCISAIEKFDNKNAKATLKALLYIFQELTQLYNQAFNTIREYTKNNSVIDSIIKAYLDQIERTIKATESKIHEFAKQKNIDLSSLTMTEIEKDANKIIIKRNFKSLFPYRDFIRKLSEERREWYTKKMEESPYLRSLLEELFNFANGKWSLYQIYSLLVAEYRSFELKDLLEITKDLEKTGYVSFLSA